MVEEAVDDEEKNGLSHADSVELNKSSSLHASVSLTTYSYELQQSRETDGLAFVEIEASSNQGSDSNKVMFLVNITHVYISRLDFREFRGVWKGSRN